MSQVVSNPPPKKRFQESEQRIKDHRDLVQSPAFEQALDFALLQYQSQLAQVDLQNFNLAASCHLRMLGAQEFVQVLRNLAESIQLQPRVKLDEQLNHNA
jgi:hypothetical protein